MIIATEKEYQASLDEISNLMDKDPDAGTEEGDRLVILAKAVTRYERKHFHFRRPTALELARFRLENRR